jgi:hypothetical protein
LVHRIVGAIIGGFVLVFLVTMVFQNNPRAQRLEIANRFEDADCRVEFFDGSRVTFNVAKDNSWKRTFNTPKIGFALMRCQTASRILESPGSFHLRDGALARLTMTPAGVVEFTFTMKPSR